MILTPEQVQELARISRGILQVQDLIDRVNEAAAATGLQLRPILTWPAALMANDISQLTFSHNLAIQELQQEAFNRLEKHLDRVAA